MNPWRKFVLGILLLPFLVLPRFSAAQAKQPTILQMQNAGVTAGTAVNFFKLNFTSGCTATYSSGAFNIACTGGGSFTAAQDLSGTSSAQQVIGMHFGTNAFTISSTAPTPGQFLFAASSSSIGPDSLLSDNGTSLAYTGTGGVTAPTLGATGSGAGLNYFTQGADNSASCPANSDCSEAPTSISTAFTRVGESAGPSATSLEQYSALSGGLTTKSWLPTSSLVLTSASNNFTGTTNTFTALFANSLNNVIHSANYSNSTSLAQLLALCPATTTIPCHVILDNIGVTRPIGGSNSAYPVIIGPGIANATWQHQVVENRGENLQCTYNAGGTTTDCIQVGQYGAYHAVNEGPSALGGPVITTQAGATVRYVMANAGLTAAVNITAFTGTSGTLTFASTNTLVAGETVTLSNFTSPNTGLNGQIVTVLSSGLSGSQFEATVTGSGYSSGTGSWSGNQPYTQTRFDVDGVNIGPSGTGVPVASLALVGVNGQGDVRHFTLTGCPGCILLYVADGPTAGDNNSIDFIDGSVACSGDAGCQPLVINSAAGGSGTDLEFINVGFDGAPLGTGCASGQGALLCIDGSAGGTVTSAYVSNITFIGGYAEVGGTSPAWVASHAYVAGITGMGGNWILPTTNNASNHYYMISTAGTTGSTQPVWSGAGCTSYAQGATCSDGTAVWTDQGTSSPGHLIEIVNARDVDILGATLGAGALNDCIALGHAATNLLGRVHIEGRMQSARCATYNVENFVTGNNLLAASQDFGYTFPGEQSTGEVFDASGTGSGAALQLNGSMKLGTAPTVTTVGSGFPIFGTEGTEPASIGSGTDGFVMDATSHCPIQWNNAVNVGCSAALGVAQTFTATQTFAAIAPSSIALSGTAPAVTTSGTTPYLNMNTLVKGTQNTCTFALTTTTFTLALSPVSLCTYTLPATAVTWYWTCTMGWSNVAGTTPTFAEGVTWAHAPSAAFQLANILTTNTGTGTQGTTATTTNANILATGSLTNSATLFLASMSGTFTGSATSGTFSPTVSLTGTGATGTAVGGCTIQ
jgi:hypothetical protein